ncbi:MAG TPA: TolC family protein [Terriglobales bacterium]|nr:TolC family protein [Terriglobales bacterium]
MKKLAVILLAAASATCFAQTQTEAPKPATKGPSFADYTKPNGHFPFLVTPYKPHTVPEPSFANTPRIDTLMKDGSIMLSMGDAIALALENNLDLAIARYNLSIADTDILRARAGADVRGVATGLVQGTPGGGVGGLGTGSGGAGAGGTSGGAGGAGSGASGLVQSTLGTGTPVDSFDPEVNGSVLTNHAAQPLSNTVTTGVNSYQENDLIANFNYSQAFPTGTRMTVGFNNTRSTNNSKFSSLVPQVASNFRLTLRQHLLSGFGFGPNLRFIRIAKNNREISDIAFRNQVVATVTQIQNIYWDLVNAYEDVRVKERSLAVAQKTLSDNREQVRIGAIAPIEVIRAENELATRNQDLILAQTTLQLQQLLMKNAIARNVNDSALGDSPVIPTDTMEVPTTEPVVPIQDLVAEAEAHRPELAQARIDLQNRRISRKTVANALLPQLDLIAWYGGSGLAGEQNPFNPQLKPGDIQRGGFSNAFSSLLNNNFPDYAVGFNFSLPIRNRVAQADQIRSELEFRQAEMRYQQLKNEISIEVRNAHFSVQQTRARVDAARKSRELAERLYDIEQKRQALGASTSFNVLQLARDLAVAESNLVATMTAYEKARVELDRVTGSTLNRNNIQLDDAQNGRVEQVPQIPGVVPRTDKQVR